MPGLECDSHWISTAAAMPVQGQFVEFMLASRECPIVGVYSTDGFRSRWTRYAPELVEHWRGAAEATLSGMFPDGWMPSHRDAISVAP